MKRCPTDQGGCGELVEMLFDSGLCQKCDAAVARGTAAVGGAPKRRGRKPKAAPVASSASTTRVVCVRYVKGLERGICASCGATRAEHLRHKQSGERKARISAGKNGGADGVLEQLRDGYARDLAQTEEKVAYLRVKVEAANEILSELQRAH